MLSKKKFHFIAVNYNNSEETFLYIDSIRSLDNKNCEIVIIDNNSPKPDISRLDDFCRNIENIVLIKNDKNIGYFPALNIGLNKIERNDEDYVIIGNNDLNFQPDFIDKLDSMDFPENIFVIAPNIIKLNKIHQNPHIIRNFSLMEKIYRRIYYSNYYISIILQLIYSNLKFIKGGSNRKAHDKIIPILMGYGACYILTPNFFKHYTNLDAPVFLMGEEGILANQVLRAGGVTLYHPDLIVNHLDHSSIGRLPSKALFKYSQFSYYYYIENCKFLR